MPDRLGMPLPFRILGVFVIGAGFSFVGLLFGSRKPGDIIVSNFVTIEKTIRKAPPDDVASRTEPLILQGPQRHVRHPLYFAVVVLFFGWWLALDYTFLLFMVFIFFLWFNPVVIRFEERELMALYGGDYARAVPRFFPSLKARWR